MGKRRHTVHTGTKALYKNGKKGSAERRNKPSLTEIDEDDAQDDMYNAVDRYHNRLEEEQFLRFDREEKDQDDIQVEGVTNVEHVMDLGMDVSDVDEEDEEDYDDFSQDDGDDSNVDEQQDEDDDEESDIASLKEKIESAKNNILDWGQKKKDYYHGDTADLEIGQEIEDAELEEEAGREVLQARLQQMEEADFYLDDDPKQEHRKTVETGVGETIMKIQAKHKKMDQMSTREIRRLLQKQHPELIPLVEHFRDSFIRPCAEETLVVQNALLQHKDSLQVRRSITMGADW
jgi:U3 small nucleolar RNA-associated protein 3